MATLTEITVLNKTRATEIESVKKLNCWGTDLLNVSIIRKMSHVQVISLSVNQIKTLEDFAYCSNLEELFIRKNQIEDLKEIVHLQKLPKLRNLWLADNPCAVGDLYRQTVLRTLPNLQKLDNLVVSKEELLDALERGVQLGEEVKVRESRLNPLPEAGDCNSNRSSRSTPLHSLQGTDDSDEDGKSNREDDSDLATGIAAVSTETSQMCQQKVLPVLRQINGRRKPTSKAENGAKGSNVLQAVLHLINELDRDELQTVQAEVQTKLTL